MSASERVASRCWADKGARMDPRLPRTSAAKAPMRTLVLCASGVMYRAFCSVTASRLFRRPAALRRSASATPPFGSWFLLKGHPSRKRDLALGSRAHSPRFARCDPSKIGKFNKRRHKVILIGLFRKFSSGVLRHSFVDDVSQSSESLQMMSDVPLLSSRRTPLLQPSDKAS